MSIKNLIEFKGKLKNNIKNGYGNLKINTNGIFLLGGDNGIDDANPVNYFFYYNNLNKDNYFIDLPPFSIARSCATSVKHDHYLYIIGGFSGYYSLSDVQRFDFFTFTWETVAPLFYRRASLESFVYNDKIYIVGGVQGARTFSEIDCYNPSKNKWNTVANLKYSRSACGVCVYEDKAYIFGGINETASESPLEIYNLKTNEIIVETEIKLNLHSFGITLFHHNKKPYFLIAGGAIHKRPTRLVYMYDIFENKLEKINNLNSRRQYLKILEFQGDIVAIGGFNGKTVIQNCEKFDPITLKWKKLNISFPYCGMACFVDNSSPNLTLKSYWKNNKICGKTTINNRIKGTYKENKKQGCFVDLETGHEYYFVDNFEIPKSKFKSMKKIKKIKVPDEYTCPITYELMLDPVVTTSGMTYERKNIVQWLSRHNTDPLTREKISSVVIPNVLLKNIILQFLEKKNIYL